MERVVKRVARTRAGCLVRSRTSCSPPPAASAEPRGADHPRGWRHCSQGAIDAVLDMRGTTLCVQGPPGSGKTYTGARMIAALLRAGKRVGIASNSHRAINVLLGEAWRAALETGSASRSREGVQGRRGYGRACPQEIPQIATGRELFGTGSLPKLIGGTVFAFIDAAAEGALDYLFVDEAGQVSVANLVAMAPAA